MTVKHTLFRKALSLFLSAVLLLSAVPLSAFAANTPLVQAANGKIVDDATVNNWKNVFPDDSTAHAGGVWVDKSVFADVDSYKAATAESDANVNLSMKDGENSFLISLSAMASTKSITGYTSIPTDTTLILDMSSSMRNSGSIDDLAVAANSAIKKLISLNYNNRVSVIQYSGDGNTNILMPLDRYTPAANGNFLEYYTQDGAGGIKTVDGVKRSNGRPYSAADTYHTGTFTQDGIYTAMKQILSEDTERVVTEGVQAGTERMPIMVLMTDGEPYRSTTDFTGRGNRTSNPDLTVDNLSSTSTDHDDYVEFLTQLTAAYAKYRIEQEYVENDLLFYTLGLGVSGNVPVLDPAAFTDTDEYWKGFLDGQTQRYDGRSVNPNNYRDFVSAVKAADGNRYRYYSDGYYYSALGNLDSAFDAIVNEIILQSVYYPTYVQTSTSANYGGYLSITDTLGEYIDVKDIKGIQLGENFYTGARFVSALNDMGSRENPASTGDEFIRAIRERLDIPKDRLIDAQNLVGSAYAAGQLAYTSDANFSNWIGWYGSYLEDQNRWHYESFWNGLDGAEATENVNNAKYRIKSYFFFGDVTEGTRETDMLYASVHIQEEIATGIRKIYFRVPATLIPMREYQVTLNGEELEDPKSLEIAGAAAPIRLLYEVGLEDGINSLNIAEAAPNAKVSGKNEYEFYTNAFPEIPDSSITANTSHAYFYPSVENERYHFHTDSLIYKADGSLYTGAKPSAGGTYYTMRDIYSLSGTTVTHTPVPEVIIDDALAGEYVAQNADGYWYIKKGAPRLDEARTVVTKAENRTGTYDVVEQPAVFASGSDYHLESILGNNGKLTVLPAQGIKLRKFIRSGEINDPANANNVYQFTIQAAPGTDALQGAYSYFMADGVLDSDPTGDRQTVTAQDGVITVSMKKLQTLYITGLPVGSYLVNEVVPGNADYMVGGFRINGTLVAAGTPVEVKESAMTAAAFLNVDRVYGEFRLSKFVESPYAPHTTDTFDFTFAVNVKLPQGANEAYKAKYHYFVGSQTAPDDNAMVDLTGDGEDDLTVTLSHNEAFRIPQLPDGTLVTVTETHLNKRDSAGDTIKAFAEGDFGFKTTVLTSASDSGTQTRTGERTVVQGETVGLRFNNVYTPAQVTASKVTVNAHKHFTGRDWENDDSFTFTLTRSGATGNVDQESIDGSDSQKQTALSMANETYTAAGTYPYYVSEEDGTIPGVSYDHVNKNFGVEVADDGFGNLYISGVHTHQTDDLTRVTGNAANGWVVDTYFANTYSADGSVNVDLGVEKTVKTESGATVSKGNYDFKLYQVDSLTGANLTGLTAKETVTTSLDGLADFADLSFAESQRGNTYYYVAVEDAKTTGKPAGITYSTAAYGYQVAVGGDEGAIEVTVTPYTGTIDRSTGAVTFGEPGTPQSAAYDTGTQVIPTISLDAAFENAYTPEPAKVRLSAVKTLTGRNMKDDEFAISLYEAESSTALSGKLLQTHKVKAAENGTAFTFDEISYTKTGTYYYVIKEQIPAEKAPLVAYDTSVYQILVTVVNDEATGKLVVDQLIPTLGGQRHDVTFENVYDPAPYQLSIHADKTLRYTNADANIPFSQGIFTMGLYTPDDTDFSDPIRTAAIGATNGETVGRATFALTYDTADVGTHTYVIREILPAEAVQQPDGSYVWNGCRYDLTAHTVTVTVSYDADTGLLTAGLENSNGAVAQDAAAAQIQNVYTSASAQVSFSGTKVLNDTQFAQAQTFQFQLYETDSTFAIPQGQAPAVLSATVDKNGEIISGTFDFDKTYQKAGNYHYLVRELIPEDRDILMSYDKNAYQITVAVTDNGAGQLIATPTVYNTALNQTVAADALNFYNTRLHPDSLYVAIGVEKTVTGDPHDLDGFDFSLDAYGDSTYASPIATTDLTSDSEGKDDVYRIFDEADIGKTYYFQITETAGNEDYMEYDESVYRFSVAISMNSEMELVAQVTNLSQKQTKITPATDEAPLTVTAGFENHYEKPATTPDTGDNANIPLLIALMVLSACGMVCTTVFARKKFVK